MSKKSFQLTVYCESEAHREEINQYAKSAGMSASRWLLHLAAREMNDVDAQEVERRKAELADAAGEIRQIAAKLHDDIAQERLRLLSKGVLA